MGIFDVEAGELVSRTAKQLKSVAELKPPEWAQFVRTGVSKNRPPVDPDWWYVRAASILRKLVILGPVGVTKLRVKYGSNHRRGYKPARFEPASGNIIRKILQQLEKAGLAKTIEKQNRKGRIISPKGTSLLDKVSVEIMKEVGIVIPKTNRPKIPPEKPKKKRKKTTKKRATKKKVKEEKAEVTEKPKEAPVEPKAEVKEPEKPKAKVEVKE